MALSKLHREISPPWMASAAPARRLLFNHFIARHSLLALLFSFRKSIRAVSAVRASVCRQISPLNLDDELANAPICIISFCAAMSSRLYVACACTRREGEKKPVSDDDSVFAFRRIMCISAFEKKRDSPYRMRPRSFRVTPNATCSAQNTNHHIERTLSTALSHFCFFY